ncbi:MAG: tetratricopeptide repeat protein [Aerococcus sp.]|nr:tetratricopeptide repeat protein [Aerococcus sp.]
MADYTETVFRLMREGKVDQANEAFEALKMDLEKYPDEDFWAQTAYHFQSAGFIPYAQSLYQEAQALFPNSERWKLLNADAHMANGEFEEALDQLLVIDEMSPYYLEALLMQADAYQGLYFPEMSEIKLKEARDLAPDEPAIILGLAELNYSEGRFQEALPYYQSLLADPNALDEAAMQVATTHYREALGESGQFEEALDLLAAIPEAERTQAEVEQMAIYYVETEDYEKANTLLSPLYEDGELSAYCLPIYAQVLTYYHEETKAIRVLDEAIVKNPLQETLYQQRAKLYLALKQDEEGAEDLEQLLTLDDENITARLLLMRTRLQMNHPEEALVVLEDAPTDIQDPEFDWLAGKIYEENEDYKKARTYYEQAYPKLKQDDSFMLDYLTFEREEGQWHTLKLAFQERPALKDQAEFQWLYDDLLNQETWGEEE